MPEIKPPSSTADASPPAPRPSIRKWDIFRVFLRSFFVQSVWNYRSLISVGFGICLIPVLKRLYSDTESRRAFLNRHLKYFNAHPYMASYALGVSIHLEEAMASGNAEAGPKLERMKSLLVSILGAVGDRLFWSTIKPCSLIIGITLLFFLEDPALQLAGLAATFLIYNLPHLYLRYNGIWEGYVFGLEVHKCLDEQRFQKWGKVYLFSGSVAFLLFLALLIAKIFVESPLSVATIGGSAVLAWIVYRATKSFYFTIIITLFISILMGFIF